MISFFKRLWRSKRGNALVIAGAALPLVIGSAGLASDTIQWVVWKRQLQRSADSAAMAGVYAKVAGKPVGACTNIASATYTDPVAYDLRKSNRLSSVPTCTLGSPPTTGGYTADIMAVRVSLSFQKQLSFSGMFMTAAPTITAASTATIVPSGEYCVVSLESTAVTGITATGNADVDMGCGMITNSTSLTAAVATGSSDVNASPIAAVGGISASNNWGDDTVLQPFTIAESDPFGSVNPPSTFPTSSCPSVTVGSNTTVTAAQIGALAETTGLTSGYYCYHGLTVRGAVTFPANSVIILDGGTLDLGGQSSVSCSGCTFVLTSRTAATDGSSIGHLEINAGAHLDLTAPGTDATGPAADYTGIMIYQDRRAVDGTNANQQNTVNGNASSILQGAFYFPSQQLTFNGTAGMTTDCLQMVARRVYYSGNMHISNVCDVDSGAGGFEGKKVRLVE